jgi:LAS superfamily LD-carboxypeptidase LdcB
MVNENSEGKITQGRVLWLDPNKANNVMVDPEDLCIKVEFNTTRKGRSIIFSGDRIVNSDSKNASVGFIEGSKVSNSTLPSLTTRYTDAISLDVMNTSSDNADDFESLGIESIDIEFDTAYAPLIKIKFIDVRGNAILSQGNMSKYKMFFELPYPIFSLKVKGFYGGTVNYCLHMQRWNASFNSETGNFEIQADFMGYTYALLTDLLFGLIRASVRTVQGQEKLIAKQIEYGENSNLIISIDDMLSKFVELNNSFEKISSEDNSAAQLQSYDEINVSIESIRSALNTFSNEIYDGITPTNTYFRSKDGVVLCVPATPESDTKYETALNTYSETIKTLIDEVNIKILDENLKLNENQLKEVVKITKITKGEIKDAKNIDYVIQKSSGKYTNDDTSVGYVKDLLKVIGTLGTSAATDNTETNIYNLKRIYNHLDNISSKLTETKKTTETEFSKKLADTANDAIGFDPTIRNIFRVLSVNSEIFLEVLKDVSVAAQTDETGKRAIEFNKISGQLNVNENVVKSNTIYPWPEYREEKSGEGYVESWLGKAPSVISNNINEVVFTNEMHTELINVAKFDRDLEKQIEAGLDIDLQANEIVDPWYPLSVADTPVNPLMTQNPYIEATTNLEVDEIKRLVLLRAFLLIGVSVFNNKIESKYDGGLLKFLGKLEADNLVAACRKLNKNGQTLLATMLNSNTTETSGYINSIITDNGLVGSSKITNPNGASKKPIMVIVDKMGFTLDVAPKDPKDYYYKYTYIRNENTKAAYIPVNTGFDGQQFYSGGNFISIDNLKDLSSNILFVSNPKNWDNASRFFKYDDGSLHVKLYELNEYQSKTMVPGFGSDLIEIYKAGINETSIKVDSTYNALVKYDLDPNNTLLGVEPLSGNYSALELKTLNYFKTPDKWNYYMGEPMWKTDTAVDSSLIGFFTEYNNSNFKGERPTNFPAVGTYLSYQIDDELFKEAVLYERDNGNIYFEPELKNMLICDSCVNAKNFNSIRNVWLKEGAYLKQKGLLSLVLNKGNKVYLPFIEFGTNKTFGISDSRSDGDNIGNWTISLFGSYFYYRQQLDEVRALLFLHTIPWQGVKNLADDISEFLMLDKHKDWTYKEEDNSKYTRVNSIRTLFQGNGAFIHAPKSWILFIGAMLWRIRYSATNSNNDPILYSGRDGREYTGIANDNVLPNEFQYLYMADQMNSNENSAEHNPWGLFIGNDNSGYDSTNATYTQIDKTLINLPKQVRDEFINYFQDWVNDENGFKFIQKELELYKSKSDYDAWFTKYNKVIDAIVEPDPKKPGKQQHIPRSKLNELFTENVVKNYQLIIGQPNKSLGIKGNLNTIFKPGTPVMDYIVSLMTTPTIVQNVNPNIWNYDYYHKSGDKDLYLTALESGYESIDSPSKSIRARGDKLRIYLDGFYNRLIELNDAYQKEVIPDANDEIEQEVFGTSDDTTIKLLIYRTLSSINDKWLNGSENKTPFTQCGAATVNETDLKYAKKYRTGATEASLIDTFRFVDRAFADIGDKFYLNINSVSELIRGNYNQSYFDIVNKILSDNNFNFIPLPTFINFNNITELESIFTPYNYNNPITFEGTGPSFVCVYVGQTSTNLDLGTDSVYPDDGLSFNRDSSGTGLEFSKETADFDAKISGDTLDGNVPVFAVNYGQQNQNYFKSVKLDQREFVETMESLQVIESISQTGDKSKPTYAGNNLFNVYQTRSYSAEVEMMGSAMIQPMMYFQLNNIPMFRGAYLIYKVTHNIKPNSMTTTFKGNRVKKTKTPLIDKATMFMNLVGTTGNGAQITSNRGQSAGYYAPIIQTLIENGATNGNVEVNGKNPMKIIPFEKLKGVGDPFNKKGIKTENRLISEAVEPLINMLNDWVKWMKGQNFKGSGGNYTYITSIFRDYNKQVEVKKQKKGAAATPGTSPHGWGIAVDIQYFTKEGNPIGNDENTPSSFKIATNPAIQWLYDNSYTYGWVLPYTLRDNSGLDEHWHWEYHGTAAKCMVEAHPTVYGYKMNTSGTVKSFVKNPKDSSGKEAVYTGCDFKYVKTADGTELGGNVNITGNNPKDALVYFIKEKKYPPYKAIGAIAAIMGESGVNLNPEVVNKSSGAYGIAQWLGKRLDDLKKLPNYNTFKTQIQYLYSELDPTNPNVDTIAKPFIIKAKSKEEMLAAMATFERWSYPVCLAKGCGYGCTKNCGDGSVKYDRVYEVLVKEAKSKNSPDESFRKRIGYLAAVQRLYDELNKNGEL